jgi:hypothetical protein
MELTFPTQAEQAITKFRSATKTISLCVICKAMGATREHLWPNTIEWNFPDDSTVRIKGRGKNHQVEALTP